MQRETAAHGHKSHELELDTHHQVVPCNTDVGDYVNHVKLTMFGVKDCAPILATNHPVYEDMAKPMKRALLMSDSEANVNVIKISILYLAQFASNIGLACIVTLDILTPGLA